jgi:hypothetical protein
VAAIVEGSQNTRSLSPCPSLSYLAVLWVTKAFNCWQGAKTGEDFGHFHTVTKFGCDLSNTGWSSWTIIHPNQIIQSLCLNLSLFCQNLLCQNGACKVPIMGSLRFLGGTRTDMPDRTRTMKRCEETWNNERRRWDETLGETSGLSWLSRLALPQASVTMESPRQALDHKPTAVLCSFPHA